MRNLFSEDGVDEPMNFDHDEPQPEGLGDLGDVFGDEPWPEGPPDLV